MFRSVELAYTYLHALARAGGRPCSLLNHTEQRFRPCVDHSENAIDESQAILVGCDREQRLWSPWPPSR